MLGMEGLRYIRVMQNDNEVGLLDIRKQVQEISIKMNCQRGLLIRYRKEDGIWEVRVYEGEKGELYKKVGIMYYLSGFCKKLVI